MTARSIEVKVSVFKAHVASQRKPGVPSGIWESNPSTVEIANAKRLLTGMWQLSGELASTYVLRAPGITEGTYIAMNQILAAEEFARGDRDVFPDNDLPIKRGKHV